MCLGWGQESTLQVDSGCVDQWCDCMEMVQDNTRRPAVILAGDASQPTLGHTRECRERAQAPLSAATHCALSSVPCAHAMLEPSVLWTAEDMRPVEDGTYQYVPSQLYPSTQWSSVHCPHALPPLAVRRLQMMSSFDNDKNPHIGKIYISNCIEAMAQ